MARERENSQWQNPPLTTKETLARVHMVFAPPSNCSPQKVWRPRDTSCSTTEIQSANATLETLWVEELLYEWLTVKRKKNEESLQIVTTNLHYVELPWTLI